VVEVAKYGKILRIFDEFTLLINLGGADGIKRGDRFVVIEEVDEVMDPDSGESLGKLEIVKAELVVADVQERISLLRLETGESTTTEIPLSARMVRDSIRTAGGGSGMEIGGGETAGMPAAGAVRSGDRVRLVV
jgi:hypothetical protein